MAIWSLTAERLNELERKLEGKIKELNDLEKTRIEVLWERVRSNHVNIIIFEPYVCCQHFSLTFMVAFSGPPSFV